MADADQQVEQPGTGNVSLDLMQNCMRTMAHPAFADAARSLAINMLDVGTAYESLGSVFKDAGRYLTAAWAALLHTSGGVTLPGLKDMCAASGFLSRGRARTLLQFLQHVGYVDYIPAARPGQPAQYVPTSVFMQQWRAHLQAGLAAACIIEPGIAPLRDRLDEPGVFEAFLAVQASRLHDLASAADQTPPFIRVFIHRYAGSQIVWTIVTTPGCDDSFPPRGSVPVTLAAMARRFGVTPMHIRRLFKEAMGEGLLTYEAKGSITFTESTRATIQFIYAAQLVELVTAARQTQAILGMPTS